MDNIQAIKKSVADEKQSLYSQLLKMTGDPEAPTMDIAIGKMLALVGARKAKVAVRRAARGAMMKCLLLTPNNDAVKKARIEFMAECARCCGEYWFDLLLEPRKKN